MKTEKHIAALLYRHQCVTVPGFGAFLSEWQSAQISEGQNSFTPPRKLISFNKSTGTDFKYKFCDKSKFMVLVKVSAINKFCAIDICTKKLKTKIENIFFIELILK